MKVNNYVLGILAHVDSGKTTLAENILFESGVIKKLGRVDHKDAFFDNYGLERVRGITIFSKQAQLKIGNKKICLLDTPGHVDFSAEMERTLQVIDYAILIVNGANGVQGHTITLWQLLQKYNVPVFLFINKMDQTNLDKDKILDEIQYRLDTTCIDFTDSLSPGEKFFDDIAMCDESLMEEFLDSNNIKVENIKSAIASRKIFPCLFGSALKQKGVHEFLDILDCFLQEKVYSEEFGSRVFKITYDDKNNRLTHMKILGGSLKVKSVLSGENWNDKIDQIRVYSGNQYRNLNEVTAGEICAVTGLNHTFSGDGLGFIKEIKIPFLEPVLNYKLILPENCNIYELYKKLCKLEEEDPQLHIVWEEQLKEIYIQVMGEVQIEVLKCIIFERFHISVDFGSSNIVYKETITEPVVGIGHFEPLKHYAEVHVLMEPLERGSGLKFLTKCSEDILNKNWQRLIITHLEEKKHIGVLTGSEITDIGISLIAGKVHQKHTEGGDFRQATYRAVRNAMKKAKSVLLEPIYEFRIELPQEYIGRAMTDLQYRNAKFEMPIIENDMAVLKGTAPVICIKDYQIELNSYSGGKGKLSCTISGYDVCHNMEEIVLERNYDSENDIENPTGSVFCSHGAGYYVEWSQVAKYAHIKNALTELDNYSNSSDQNIINKHSTFNEMTIAQEEIDAIYEQTFGRIKKERTGWSRKIISDEDKNYNGVSKLCKRLNKEEYLLIDGYNVIFAWDKLRKLSEMNIDSARDKLMDILCNYQGYTKEEIILIFDAYKVHGGKGEIFDYHNIHVVYTKEAETADQYIEKVTNEIGKKYNVVVVTSDRLEQMIVWGQGARRLPVLEFINEIDKINEEIWNKINEKNQKTMKRNYLFDNMSEMVEDYITEKNN